MYKIIIKNIPNILSILRIVISIIIPLTPNNKYLFAILYILVGITDVLDGYLARKLNATSQLGAKLDSIGDFVFAFSIIISLLLFKRNLILKYIIYVLIIFIIRVCSVIINGIKNKSFSSIHTILNKITGLIIYVSVIPIMLNFEVNLICSICIVIALLSSIEELLLVIIKKNIDVNCKGIWEQYYK